MDYIPTDITLGQWIPLWMDSYKRGTIKGTSYHQLELLARLIPDDLKEMPVSEIRPMQIQAFYNSFGLTASKSYMDKMRVMVNALFLEAFENGLCDKNPTRRLKAPRIAEKPREAYTVEEVKLILNYAMSCDNSRIATAVMFLLLTGLRRGELLGLQWGDISKHTLTINRSVFLEDCTPTVIEHRAKTAASLRTIPLLPELEYRIQALPKHGPYVFSTRTGTLWHPRNFSRDYDRFFARLREAEPSVRCLSPHSCRHTFATLSLQGGSDIRVVQMLLGHTDIKTTSRYTHPDMAAMSQAVEGLRDTLNSRK